MVGDGPKAARYELVEEPEAHQPTGAPAGLGGQRSDQAGTPRGHLRYRQAGSQSVAVATGRVLVRLAPGLTADHLEQALAGSRLSIDERLSYAPNAAWVVAASGDAAEGLAAIERLAALPGVAHVEPELLRARTSR